MQPFPDTKPRAPRARVQRYFFIRCIHRLAGKHLEPLRAAADADRQARGTGAVFFPVPESVFYDAVFKGMKRNGQQASAGGEQLHCLVKPFLNRRKLIIDSDAQRLKRPGGRMQSVGVEFHRNRPKNSVGKTGR